MPTIMVINQILEVPSGTKLVSAIKALGIDIGHRCGGHARCTTCRVTVEVGEPATFTRAEFLKLRSANLLGEVRLACQMVVDEDMQVQVLKTLQSEGWPDTGLLLAELVTPEEDRFSREQLEAET